MKFLILTLLLTPILANAKYGKRKEVIKAQAEARRDVRQENREEHKDLKKAQIEERKEVRQEIREDRKARRKAKKVD